MDMTLKLSDFINFCAIVASPIAAVWISIFIQERRELRNRRFSAFLTLVSTRHLIATDEQVRAFNSIDVLFHECADVRRHWKDYLALLSQTDRQVEWEIKKLELLKSMATQLGYSDSIDALDLFRTYGPKGLTEVREKQEQLLNELLRVLKATDKFPIKTEELKIETLTRTTEISQ